MPMREQPPLRVDVGAFQSRSGVWVGEVLLHVGEWDDGEDRPPLLLLHGLANRWQAMAPLVPFLARDWHILAPDLRGHGQSGRATQYSIADFAVDAIELVS